MTTDGESPSRRSSARPRKQSLRAEEAAMTMAIAIAREAELRDLMEAKKQSKKESVAPSSSAAKPAKAAAPLAASSQMTTLASPSNASTTAAAASATTAVVAVAAPPPACGFDVAAVRALAQREPDRYWTQLPPISMINASAPVTVQGGCQVEGAVYSMELSPDGSMLATTSVLGWIAIWDLEDFSPIQRLRDEREANIDEFWVARFSPDTKLVFAAGKLKSRTLWSTDDNDNAILPSPIKIFDLVTGAVVGRLEGHQEEVLCIKLVAHAGTNYLITCSQDGTIRRWTMSDDWRSCTRSERFAEHAVTCMAFTVSFVPNTGNSLFCAACDEGVRVYSLDTLRCLHHFSDLFASFCDSIKFVATDAFPLAPNEHVLVARGCELLDLENFTVASRANSVMIYKLVVPTKSDGVFELVTLRQLQHPEYNANSYLMRLTASPHCVLAPTVNGEVFVWSLGTGELCAILRDHDEREVRDIILHPTRPLLLTCADDCKVHAYSWANRSAESS